MKKKLIHFLSILMIFSIMIEITGLSSIKANAGEWNGTGSGSGNYTGRGSYNDSQQGYRFTIIDEKGNPVSNIIDIVNIAPPNNSISAYNCKTQSLNFRKPNGYEWITVKEMYRLGKGRFTENMPSPL